ncbi:hypothetical protein JCM24511_08754 [Saitozyma sp. JCM 24511]|nr:hypothetical protein JCM24511_08754 [Saitozyma sp. JCM 24511]
MSGRNENVDGVANRIDGRALPASPLEEPHDSRSQANKVQVPVALPGGQGDNRGPSAADGHPRCNTGVDNGGQGSRNKSPHSRSVGKTPGIYLPVKHNHRAESLEDNHRAESFEDNHRAESLEDNHRAESLEDNHRAESFEGKKPWIHLDPAHHEVYKGERLGLFYDLVVVAVLSVFSTTHELSSPHTIVNYLLYYIVLYWTWVSQTYYDVRFQAGDLYHYFFKLFQMSTFAYIGAASGNWNPGHIQDPGRLNMTGFEAAQQIFEMSFWASRQLWEVICPIVVLLISMALSITAASIDASSASLVHLKIGLLYTGIVLEFIMLSVLSLGDRDFCKVKSKDIAERYRAFTLIILGEGFISLLRAASEANSSLSTNDAGTYGQVVVVARSDGTSFGDYKEPEVEYEVDREPEEACRDLTWLWEMLHFFLLFGILLLLAGMINFIVALSLIDGLDMVNSTPNTTFDYAVNGFQPPPLDLNRTAILLDKLPLIPEFKQEMDTLIAEAMKANRTEDTIMLAYQYLGQIIVDATRSYGVEVTTEMSDTLDALSTLNVTYSEDQAERSSLQSQAKHLAIELTQDPIDVALSGTQWLYPTAVR